MKTLFALLVTFAILPEKCCARVTVTIEQKVVHLLAGSVFFCMETNSGVPPTTWEQLSSFDFTYWNRALLDKGLGTVQELYVFTPTNLALLTPRKGFVVIARNEPFKMDGKRDRYIVYKSSEDDTQVADIQSTTILEDEFQLMLKQAGVTLPDPNPAQTRAAREAVENSIAAEGAMQKRLAGSVAGPTLRQRWLLIKDRFKRVFLTRADEGVGDPFVTEEVGFVRIRPVPVALAALALVAVGFFAGRMYSKRKPPSGSTP
jgi:hypothetical protein